VRKFGIRHGAAGRIVFPESSLDGFYASHVLEHLSRATCEQLLRNIHRWLKPTGVLRIVLPDLRRLAEAYLSGALDANHFVLKTYLAPEPRSLNLPFSHGRHQWMYDAASFKALLRDNGYREIEETAFGVSKMNRLAALDLPGRKHESFYIEARV